MKSTELMIGDWVLYHKHITQKITSIHPDYDDWDDLNPVPLTDKILKVNGFEYRHKNFASLSYDHPFQLELFEWPDENGIGTWMLGDIIKIRYVHELQHAMRLAGIDKEIIL